VKALKVLVAEDDPGLRTFYQLALIEQGHTVSAVGNGQEALRAMSTDLDLVITATPRPRCYESRSSCMISSSGWRPPRACRKPVTRASLYPAR
jgi:CheY-like chemotaxis protein